MTEDATTDRDGRLRRAELWLSPPSAADNLHAILDAEHGSVAIETASLDIHWNVPNDGETLAALSCGFH